MDEVELTTSCYTLDNDFAVYDDEEAQSCVDLCVTRLEAAQPMRSDGIRLDPRTSLPGDLEKTNFDAKS